MSFGGGARVKEHEQHLKDHVQVWRIVLERAPDYREGKRGNSPWASSLRQALHLSPG